MVSVLAEVVLEILRGIHCSTFALCVTAGFVFQNEAPWTLSAASSHQEETRRNNNTDLKNKATGEGWGINTSMK